MDYRTLQSRRLRLGSGLRSCALVVVTVSIITCNFGPTVGAQTKSEPALTASEKREARQLSVMFTRRLGETLDLRVVMGELFVRDAGKRYVEEEKQRAARFGTEITLSPGIFVEAALLETASPDEWLRLYAAATNLTVFGLIYASRKNTDFEDLKVTDLYPPGITELVQANPLLQNLIEAKTALGSLKSAADMRSAATTLEQANTIMRRSLPRQIDLEKTTIRMAMRDSTKRPLKPKEVQTARVRLMQPRLEVLDSDHFGFPKGTRMIWISTFALMDLLLVRIAGKLRIVWAQPFAD